MSRIERASVTTFFGYLKLGLSLVVGVALVPFVLDRVGPRLYGFWLASGEVLAYAAMADFGVLGVLPWLVAEADGRADRVAIRRLMGTAFVAAAGVSAVYAGLAALLWSAAPLVFKLEQADSNAIAGPLLVVAITAAVVLPLRVAGSALVGLQDVRFHGMLTTCSWAMDVAITVTLLFNGYGLYALALGASIPSLFSSVAAFVRLRIIAPDLFSAWPRPSRADLARLYREGVGTWLSSWGWRLSAATDGIVLASLGHPVWITVLAMTAKLANMLTNMSWVPGDSALVGLAQLSGEGQPQRTRAATVALLRLYLVLGAGAACIVLAVNGAFVSVWVGASLYGGTAVNLALAALVIASSAGHAVAVVTSVLGARLQVGVATLVSGTTHVVLALLLGRWFGIVGIPLAAVCAQGIVLTAILLPHLLRTAGLTPGGAWADVLRPWLVRAVPMLAASLAAGFLMPLLPLPAVVATGALVGVLCAWIARPLVLDYPPVAAAIRARLAPFKLEGLVSGS